MRRARRAGLVLALAVANALGGPAGRVRPAAADALDDGAVIFARGATLVRADARGKGERVIATLPGTAPVRALRTDAAGTVLLVDVGGRWSWLPLDGSTTALAELPCADGPAQIAEDGACVLCRSTRAPAGAGAGSVIVQLATGKVTPVAVPTAGARLVGAGAERRLIWADTGGVWAAPVGKPERKARLAPEAPLRGFLPSPDGARAFGVFADKVFMPSRQTQPAEVLMGFALDGVGARRASIKAALPIAWSHDGRWALLQDRGSACITAAMGGQYKCWKGYTGASLAPDGAWALLLGARDGDADSGKGKGAKGKGAKGKGAKDKGAKDKGAKDKGAKDKGAESRGKGGSARAGADAKGQPRGGEGEGAGGPVPDEGEAGPEGAEAVGPGGEPGSEGDHGGGLDDVEVAPPSGPLALYRAKLDGPYTEKPVKIVTVVDGAAVWVPARAPGR